MIILRWIWHVFHYFVIGGSKSTVEFDQNNAGAIILAEGIPYVKIVIVDVNGNQNQIRWGRCILRNSADIFSGDEFLVEMDGWIWRMIVFEEESIPTIFFFQPFCI